MTLILLARKMAKMKESRQASMSGLILSTENVFEFPSEPPVAKFLAELRGAGKGARQRGVSGTLPGEHRSATGKPGRATERKLGFRW